MLHIALIVSVAVTKVAVVLGEVTRETWLNAKNDFIRVLCAKAEEIVALDEVVRRDIPFVHYDNVACEKRNLLRGIELVEVLGELFAEALRHRLVQVVRMHDVWNISLEELGDAIRRATIIFDLLNEKAHPHTTRVEVSTRSVHDECCWPCHPFFRSKIELKFPRIEANWLIRIHTSSLKNQTTPTTNQTVLSEREQYQNPSCIAGFLTSTE